MSYIIQTNHLSKTIAGKDLLKDVNLHVKKGEFYGFLGPNGAGKTTLLRILTNLWKPTAGTVELFGETLTPGSYEVLKKMGNIIEFPSFYEHLSGKENLSLHCEYMGYYKHGAINQVLETLHLSDAGKKPVKNYSLGMRQRLGIARAILHRPELLILDEPLNGLDPAGMRQIRDILKMLHTDYDMTIILSSHLLGEIENIADTIGIIKNGQMIREVSMQEIHAKNTAYIELGVNDLQKAAYLLSDQLKFTNFRVMDNSIRIYDQRAVIPEISKTILQNDLEIYSIKKESESLEDYFLKITEEVDK